jgi:hypothetical protein
MPRMPKKHPPGKGGTPQRKQPRPQKVHVSARINPATLADLDKLAERLWRSRSDLIDRAVEQYVLANAHLLADEK